MTTTITTNYIDGTSSICSPTLFDTIQAERHAAANGIGTLQEAPITMMAYSTYVTLRRGGQLTPGMTFENWAQTVSSIDTTDTNTDTVPTPAASPATPDMTGLPAPTGTDPATGMDEGSGMASVPLPSGLPTPTDVSA